MTVPTGGAKPAALLLTGGASTRMGSDKATLDFESGTLASRAARTLGAVADPVLVVGAEAGTGLPAVEDPRDGPLVAVVEGARELARRGHVGPVLVLACDMPFVSAEILAEIAGALGDADAAIPLAHEREQPLCACYTLGALTRTGAELVARGERSMQALSRALRVVHPAGLPQRAFEDLDTPEDLRRVNGS